MRETTRVREQAKEGVKLDSDRPSRNIRPANINVKPPKPIVVLFNHQLHDKISDAGGSGERIPQPRWQVLMKKATSSRCGLEGGWGWRTVSTP